MRTSTHTLDLDPAVDWRLEVIPNARRKAPAVVGGIEILLYRERATDERAVSRSRQARIRPGPGDAMEFALFTGTLAVIGWLHFELLALVW